MQNKPKNDALPGTRFDALVFDCDGVYAKNSENIAFEVVAKHVSDFLGPRGGPTFTAREMMDKYAGKTFRDYQAEIHEETGHRIPDEMDAQITRAIVVKLKTDTETDPSLRKLISTFQQTGSAIGMASSSPHNRLDAVIHATGTRKILDRTRLDNVVSAEDDCAHVKPDPESYLLIAEKLGVDPERALTIEDSPSGVKAGVAAGLTVIGYLGADHIQEHKKAAHGQKLLDAGATVLVNNMAEIIAMKPQLEQGLTAKLASLAQATKPSAKPPTGPAAQPPRPTA